MLLFGDWVVVLLQFVCYGVCCLGGEKFCQFSLAAD